MSAYDYSGCYSFSTQNYASADVTYGLSSALPAGITIAACAAKCNNPAVIAMLSDASESGVPSYLCVCYSRFDSQIFDSQVSPSKCTLRCGDGNACGASYACPIFTEPGILKPCVGDASVYMINNPAGSPVPSPTTTITTSSEITPTSHPTVAPKPTTPVGSPSPNTAGSVAADITLQTSTTIVNGKTVVVTVSSTVTPEPASAVLPAHQAPTAAIIGGVVAGVAVIGLVVVGAVILSRRERARKARSEEPLEISASGSVLQGDSSDGSVGEEEGFEKKGLRGVFVLEGVNREAMLPPPSYDTPGVSSSRQADVYDRKG